MTSTSTPSTHTPEGVRGAYDSNLFESFRHAVRARFTQNAEKQPVFLTAAPDGKTLFDIYLNHLPEDQRQTCTCNTCRSFINRVGGLVVINPGSGQQTSAIWDIHDAPDFYGTAVAAMLQHIEKAKVTGQYIAEKYEIGEQVTGAWTHFNVRMPACWVNKSVTKTPGQVMASKREDFRTMRRALSEFDLETVTKAVTLLKLEKFDSAEKVIGPAEFLKVTMEYVDAVRGKIPQDNILWRAIATAPDGFCHPRSSMIGTLLEDLAAGMSGADAAARFNAKMHPTAYMRPKAAPTEGAVKRAEVLAEQLGIAPSLQRRYARMEDVAETLWVPPAVSAPPAAAGVFAGLAKSSKPTPAAVTSTDVQRITWAKFQATVLPQASELFVNLQGSSYLPFTALLTAVNADAPPLFQWDSLEQRNPVSWYTYSKASQLTPLHWSLHHAANSSVRVKAIVAKPNMWFGGADKFAHQGLGVILLLEGCRDTQKAGSGLFPTCMRSELHEVRSVIEAYSGKHDAAGQEEADAAGVMINAGKDAPTPIPVSARIGGVLANYIIDRWD